MPLAVYIHWPFCKAKCPYCDFNSHVRDSVDTDRWQAALLRELETLAARMSCRQAVSIFFGGGTPSLMPPETVAALIARVKTLFPSAQEPEITLEANPTSVEASNFHTLREAGITRVSMGVQSLRQEGLRFLGRQHSVREALAAVELAARIFPRYSFDLIYARPEQTPKDWEQELRDALPYIAHHSSLYQLTIEEDTPFARLYATGNFTLPDEESAADMYELTADILREKGLLTYEISNYATPGEECFHNLSIWRGTPYLGIGPGAHGRVFFDAPAPAPYSPQWAAASPSSEPCLSVDCTSFPLHITATKTVKSPERWLAQVERTGHGLEETICVSDSERFEEQVLMGLRLREGIDLHRLPCPQRISALLDSQALSHCVANGIMERDGSCLRLTASGRLVLDSIVAALLTA